MTKHGQLGAYIGAVCDDLPSYKTGEMRETFKRLAERWNWENMTAPFLNELLQTGLIE